MSQAKRGAKYRILSTGEVNFRILGIFDTISSLHLRNPLREVNNHSNIHLPLPIHNPQNTLLEIPHRDPLPVRSIDLFSGQPGSIGHKQIRNQEQQNTRARKDESGSRAQVASVNVVDVRHHEAREPCCESLSHDADGDRLRAETVRRQLGGDGPPHALEGCDLKGDVYVPVSFLALIDWKWEGGEHENSNSPQRAAGFGILRNTAHQEPT